MSHFDITSLNLYCRQLLELPDLRLYNNLQMLNCSFNILKNLDNLPFSLKKLYCRINELTCLDNLPPDLKILE